MKLSPLEERIYMMIEPTIIDLGFDLVTLRVDGDGSSQKLTVMAEDPKTEKLGIDDCAKISRAISTLLDVEDPIEGAYRLEISSPGIDRPLVHEKDFTRYKNMLIKVETHMPINGQRRFKGVICDYKDEKAEVILQIDAQNIDIAFDNIRKANLVITDELLRKDLNKNKKKHKHKA